MSNQLRLTVSANVDASKLARRFVEGVSRTFALSPDTAVSLKVLVSDAAADCARSSHPFEMRVTNDDASIDIVIEGAGLATPAVVSPPDELMIDGGERAIHLKVRRP